MTQSEAQKLLNEQIEKLSDFDKGAYIYNGSIVPNLGTIAGDFGEILGYVNDNGTLKYNVANKEISVGHLRVASQIKLNNK